MVHMVTKNLWSWLQKCWQKTTNSGQSLQNPWLWETINFHGRKEKFSVRALKNMCKRPLHTWQKQVLFCNGNSVYSIFTYIAKFSTCISSYVIHLSVNLFECIMWFFGYIVLVTIFGNSYKPGRHYSKQSTYVYSFAPFVVWFSGHISI